MTEEQLWQVIVSLVELGDLQNAQRHLMCYINNDAVQAVESQYLADFLIRRCVESDALDILGTLLSLLHHSKGYYPLLLRFHFGCLQSYLLHPNDTSMKMLTTFFEHCQYIGLKEKDILPFIPKHQVSKEQLNTWIKQYHQSASLEIKNKIFQAWSSGVGCDGHSFLLSEAETVVLVKLQSEWCMAFAKQCEEVDKISPYYVAVNLAIASNSPQLFQMLLGYCAWEYEADIPRQQEHIVEQLQPLRLNAELRVNINIDAFEEISGHALIKGVKVTQARHSLMVESYHNGMKLSSALAGYTHALTIKKNLQQLGLPFSQECVNANFGPVVSQEFYHSAPEENAAAFIHR
jgi:hypothetical protein